MKRPNISTRYPRTCPRSKTAKANAALVQWCKFNTYTFSHSQMHTHTSSFTWLQKTTSHSSSDNLIIWISPLQIKYKEEWEKNKSKACDIGNGRPECQSSQGFPWPRQRCKQTHAPLHCRADIVWRGLGLKLSGFNSWRNSRQIKSDVHVFQIKYKESLHEEQGEGSGGTTWATPRRCTIFKWPRRTVM